VLLRYNMQKSCIQNNSSSSPRNTTDEAVYSEHGWLNNCDIGPRSTERSRNDESMLI
jgi:hypothetical protein